MSPKPLFVSVDFETRSAVDLRDVGVHKYAEHPSTDVWCAAYWIGDNGPMWLWHTGEGVPWDLKEALAAGAYIRAWNAQFERIIWQQILTPRHGWPELPTDRFVCSMVAGAAAGLPMNLEEAAIVLGLEEQKDMAGNRLMRQMAKPRRIEDDGTLVWWDDADRRARLAQYCAQDVRTECAVWRRLPPCMDKRERRLYLLDQDINDRGVALDRVLIARARTLAGRATAALDVELAEVTHGAVVSATKVQDLKRWVGVRLGEIPASLDKAAVAALLDGDLPEDVRRALEIRSEAGKTSVTKYEKMAAVACADGKARGLLQFYGASTGRWCLTGDHEVLTPEGWVRLDRWSGGRIATWSPDETCAFTPAGVVSFPYEGPLLRHTNKRMDQLATPDHRMPSWVRGVFAARTLDALPVRFQFPYTGRRVSLPAGDPDAIRVLVMVQADGHYTADGALRLHFRKARKIERCRALLRRAGVKYAERANRDGTAVFDVPRRTQPLWLLSFRDKTFGWWLLDVDPEVVLRELEHWDGSRCGPNSIQYVTAIAQNAEVVQALAHLGGWAASRLVKSRPDKGWADCHIVNLWEKPSNRSEVRGRPEVEAFFGDVYCAETTTGFFYVRRNGKVWITGNSGRQIQPQNFPRGEVKITPEIIRAIREGTLDTDVMETLSSALRGALIASPGMAFYVADFNAIEARVVAWLAGQRDLLTLFGSGGKVYETMAARIFGVPVDAVTPEQRQVGKMVVLGCGFGMGHAKFAAQTGVSVELAQAAVETYRATYPKIRQLWYDLDDAAVRTVRTGAPTAVGPLRFRRVRDWLAMDLPVGRSLWYYRPRLVERPVPWGGTKPAVQIETRNSVTRQWITQDMYGGIWTENATQAVARDVMADALLRVEDAGFRTVLTVHDEIIAEADPSRDIEEFVALLSVVPSWATGCPLKAEGYTSDRYRK